MVQKVYAYITRVIDGSKELLVFKHSVSEAGIQVPKGTVELGETPEMAVVRETIEETGVRNIASVKEIAKDISTSFDGQMVHRVFFEVCIFHDKDCWTHNPTGGGGEDGIQFYFFWIKGIHDVELVRGHADYLETVWPALE